MWYYQTRLERSNQWRIRFSSTSSSPTPFPKNTGLHKGLLNKILWEPEIAGLWDEYRNNGPTRRCDSWKDRYTEAGEAARTKGLRKYWLQKQSKSFRKHFPSLEDDASQRRSTSTKERSESASVPPDAEDDNTTGSKKSGGKSKDVKPDTGGQSKDAKPDIQRKRKDIKPDTGAKSSTKRQNHDASDLAKKSNDDAKPRDKADDQLFPGSQIPFADDHIIRLDTEIGTDPSTEPSKYGWTVTQTISLFLVGSLALQNGMTKWLESCFFYHGVRINRELAYNLMKAQRCPHRNNEWKTTSQPVCIRDWREDEKFVAELLGHGVVHFRKDASGQFVRKDIGKKAKLLSPPDPGTGGSSPRKDPTSAEVSPATEVEKPADGGSAIERKSNNSTVGTTRSKHDVVDQALESGRNGRNAFRPGNGGSKDEPKPRESRLEGGTNSEAVRRAGFAFGVFSLSALGKPPTGGLKRKR